MEPTLACPVCTMTDIVDSVEYHECLTCGNEWANEAAGGDDVLEVFDSAGNQLFDGDSITVVKDLKVKGSSRTLKVGTKIKGIRLVPGDHEIDCKVDGSGVYLKAMFVKKA